MRFQTIRRRGKREHRRPDSLRRGTAARLRRNIRRPPRHLHIHKRIAKPAPSHQRIADIRHLSGIPVDAQRIQRALEVFEVSGQPISSFQTGRTHNPASPLVPGHLISLEPQDRAWLHARIAQRFDDMLASGFLDEMRALRARGDLSTELPSMRCVGYRQAWDMLAAHGDALTREHLDELRELGTAATRQLGKRQLTWLRSMPQRRVIACDAPDALAQVLHAVEERLGSPA